MSFPPLLEELLEAAEQLSPEDQEGLLVALQRQIAERGRRQVIADHHESRQEFDGGGCKPASTDDLLNEILS